MANLGNFRSFGDSKIIPRCSVAFFKKLLSVAGIKSVTNTREFPDTNSLLEKGIYNVDEKSGLLGFPADGFTSSYYTGLPISIDDMKFLKNKVFSKYDIMPENLTIHKESSTDFEILVASEVIKGIDECESYTIKNSDDKEVQVKFKYGEHHEEMTHIISNLEKAKKYATNKTQEEMLEKYIGYFKSGEGALHKDAQKLWVQDISPTIETNIGFIETYREPSGIIGEYEALVAIQNKERTAKFATMVANAEQFLSLLPWDHSFEKPKFHAPDFTSLEVLTFTGSGIPAGINIPNYDDVRLNVGFKNVSLGNILSAATKGSSKLPPTFISEADRPIFEKYQGESFEVQVGIHELLGHGSGKLLTETSPGEYNFDHLNPPIGLDGRPVATYYKFGETWGSKFGALAGAYEECRAESIAMYLITNRKLLEIFGFQTKKDQDNIIYAGFLQMARAGLMALQYWDPESKKWGQAHMQARFSIMKTFLKHAEGGKFLKLVPSEDGKDLFIDLDRSLIETVGHECVKDYLLHLHVYKCSADVKRGSEYFIDRSTVTEDLASLRDLVISKKLPRRQYIQANTLLNDQDEVVLKEYDETSLGMIQSFIDRNV